jgi:hypothetical protein
MYGTNRQHQDRACFSRSRVASDTAEVRRDNAWNAETGVMLMNHQIFAESLAFEKSALRCHIVCLQPDEYRLRFT